MEELIKDNIRGRAVNKGEVRRDAASQPASRSSRNHHSRSPAHRLLAGNGLAEIRHDHHSSTLHPARNTSPQAKLPPPHTHTYNTHLHKGNPLNNITTEDIKVIPVEEGRRGT